jgi:uncharacterized protein (DUF2164 family)
MNERMYELALQADLMRYKSDGINIKIEKFAELIVRECLDQCYNRGMNDALYAGQLKAAAYIEEHFGVE